MRRAYQAIVLDDFFKAGFRSPRPELQFEGRELSGASIELVKRKLDRFLQEFNELAEIEYYAGRFSTVELNAPFYSWPTAYFNNDREGYAIKNARMLLRQLGLKPRRPPGLTPASSGSDPGLNR